MFNQIPIEQETHLVERAVNGDQAAFGELVEPLRKPLFSYIYRMVTLPQDAEDRVRLQQVDRGERPPATRRRGGAGLGTADRGRRVRHDG